MGKTKLSYHVIYTDDEDNEIPEPNLDRDDFTLQCENCTELIFTENKISVENTLKYWNYCPFCGFEIEKD